jgi:hypothetical protein
MTIEKTVELSDVEQPKADDVVLSPLDLEAAEAALVARRIADTEKLDALLREKYDCVETTYKAEADWHPFSRPTPRIMVTMPFGGGEVLEYAVRLIYGFGAEGLPALYPIVEVLFTAPVPLPRQAVASLVGQFSSLCLSRADAYWVGNEVSIVASVRWTDTDLDVIADAIPRHARILLLEISPLLCAIDKAVDAAAAEDTNTEKSKETDHVTN